MNASPDPPPARPPAVPAPAAGGPDALADRLPGCLTGDPAAWRAFAAASAPLVRAAVRKAVGSGHAGLDPDDVVQDVYVRLVRDDFALLRRYDPSRARLGTWVTLIARSVAIDALRRRRLATVELGETARNVPDPRPAGATPAGGSAEEAAELGRLGPDVPLHLLSERQALVVRLLFEDGRSVPEAAAILGVNEQTVRSTKHKALTRLRRHVADDGGFSEESRG